VIQVEKNRLNDQVLMLPDGRQLGYCIVGKGTPVLYFHGTASSRLEILLLKELAYAGNLQIIGVDRPGYGLSTYKQKKNIQDVASDINYLVDCLGLKRFGLLGWSGGGVFALAYFASFSERVTKALIVGTPSLPFDVSTAHDIPLARFIMKVPFIGFLAMKNLSADVLKASNDVGVFLRSRSGKQLLHSCSKDDLNFFSDPRWMALMYQSMAEAFRQGDFGVKAAVGEHQLFMKPWSFSFSRIPGANLSIWQGTEDKTCRVKNAYLISQKIPCATLEVFEGKGHCVMFQNIDKLDMVLSRSSRR
jgi:pimeloyl-ACP methyl ester carboxylesterase